MRTCNKTCFTSPARQQGGGVGPALSRSYGPPGEAALQAVAGATPPPLRSGLVLIHALRRDLSIWSLVLLWGSLGLFVGCNSASSSKTEVQPIEKTVQQGNVTLTVRADRGQVGVADPFQLSIQVTAPEGQTVEMPQFEGKLGGFDIQKKSEPPSIPVPQGRFHQQQYRLETLTAGELEIPPVSVQVNQAKSGTTQPATVKLTTEPFKIRVASLVADPFDPAKFRDIKGTVELPYSPDRTWLWGTLAVAVVGVAALAMTLYLRRRAMARALPPDQWALRELDRLVAERLVEKGALEAFYLRLSGLVRQYIERQFGLKAPERTTQEFLAEMRTTPALLAEHKELLGEFLTAADMVKFAKFAPTGEEVSLAIQTARNFIVQSAEVYHRFKRLEVAA